MPSPKQLTAKTDTLADKPILVSGVPEPTRAKEDWRKSLTYILAKSWSLRAPSQGTRQAETGLGIDGTPHYFYVMRTEQAFGGAVFLFRENDIVEWPAGVNGATPFDSGGLWHNKIAMHSSPASTRKRQIFEKHQEPLSSWAKAFGNYIARNYAHISDYIEGEPPQTPSHPIILGQPNSSRAWTWEVRVPCDLLDANVNLICGCLSSQDYSKYLNWLWSDSNLEDRKCRSIHLWMRDNITLAPEGELALTVAERQIAEAI